MQDFDFAAPTSVEEALKLLQGVEGEAQVLAGGTDLIDQIRRGARRPSLVVDVTRIPELTAVSRSPEGALRIGAAASCSSLNVSELLRGSSWSMLLDATRIIGDVKIQN